MTHGSYPARLFEVSRRLERSWRHPNYTAHIPDPTLPLWGQACHEFDDEW